MKSGELVMLDRSSIVCTYFRMYAGDLIVELIPDAPVAATVKNIQTPEQFLSQYDNKKYEFKTVNYE